jgi:4-carboxymuconolactone decarboxylase
MMPRTTFWLTAAMLAFHAAPVVAGEKDQVSRIPEGSEAPSVGGRAGRAPLNAERAMAFAPNLMEARKLGAAKRAATLLPRSLRELAIVRTAEVMRADYILFHHRPALSVCGYSASQIRDIHTWRTSARFDPRQRAVLTMVDEMARDGEVSDATFGTVMRLFSPQEAVELVYTISDYCGNALLLKALRVKLDDQPAPTGAC